MTAMKSRYSGMRWGGGGAGKREKAGKGRRGGKEL